MRPLKFISRPLKYFDRRPAGLAVDTLVIHSMYAPESKDPHSPRACFALLKHYQVSAHFSIDRRGKIYRHVKEENRAWHAGKSRMPNDGREGVNAFSIGVELIGTYGKPFTQLQYRSLARLIHHLTRMFPLKFMVGHEHIAPGRKQDPGPSFDWKKLRQLVIKTAAGKKLRILS